MILTIIKIGSPMLRKKSYDIDENDDFKEIATNMFQTIKKYNGIGLAGPQVSVLKNIFIIDSNPLKEKGIMPVEKVIVNPEILNFSDDTAYYTEGCLSIPDIFEDLLRPENVEVRYRDENYDLHEEVLNGVVARIFQHEYDHLQGILFVDRLNPLKRNLIKGKLRKTGERIR
jgi:peptide deformylase